MSRLNRLSGQPQVLIQDEGGFSAVIARSRRRRRNPEAACEAPWLLRCARNDAGNLAKENPAGLLSPCGVCPSRGLEAERHAASNQLQCGPGRVKVK